MSRGFTVMGDPDADQASDETPTFASASDTGDQLLAPILEPIRHGVALADFDLHLDVRCPDGVVHGVVIRASPITVPRHSSTPTDQCESEADGADEAKAALPDQKDIYYVGVAVDVTGQQRFERELSELVDRYRLLTEVSPDVVFVHQNGRFVYGNRAMGRMIGAETDDQYAQAFAKYYGSLITDFTHPDDLTGWVNACPAHRAGPVLRAR